MRIFAAFCLLLASTGCTAETTSEVREVASESAAVQGLFVPNPDPPGYGWNTVEITLTDSESLPVTGAIMDVQPWMIAHGHGSPHPAEVTELGDGLYEASVFYNMGGRWELRIDVAMTSGADRFVVDQNVK